MLVGEVLVDRVDEILFLGACCFQALLFTVVLEYWDG